MEWLTRVKCAPKVLILLYKMKFATLVPLVIYAMVKLVKSTRHSSSSTRVKFVPKVFTVLLVPILLNHALLELITQKLVRVASHSACCVPQILSTIELDKVVAGHVVHTLRQQRDHSYANALVTSVHSQLQTLHAVV